MAESDRTVAAEAGFDGATVLIVVCEGPDLVVRALNATMQDLVPGREIEGRPIAEALPEVTSDQGVERYLEVFHSGVPYRSPEWRTQMRTVDGDMVEVITDLTIVPWRRDGEVVGVVATGVDVSEQARQRRAAENVEAARRTAELRAETAEETVQVIQSALLPDALPVVPTVDLSARYLLAVDNTRAGGDWFDAVVRPDGHVALVVGDVVGHGVDASAVMGSLRSVLQERLTDAVPLGDAVRRLDAFAATCTEARASTVCVVELDPETGDIEYCTAGHPPPLVVSSTGETRYLVPSGAGPLATGCEVVTVRDRMEPDDLVLLYTDGIVERPQRDLARGTVELAEVASSTARNLTLSEGAPARTVERVCQLTLEVLTRIGGYTDDITLLAAQRVPAITPFDLVLPAQPRSLGDLRHALSDWLAAWQVRSLDEMTVQHALGELATNVVEHAYVDRPDAERTVQVRADVDARGRFVATVSDNGRWQASGPQPGRGAGLVMARNFVGQVEIDPGEEGTTVTVAHELTRPVLMLASAGTGGWEVVEEPPFEAALEDAPTPTVRVRGAVDLDGADALRTRLLRTLPHGGREVLVDLAGVTFLGSSGVQVLHEVLRSDDAGFTLVAPYGSVAQHVLQLVKLPYLGE